MKKSKMLSPFQKFVKIESFSGILLFVATLVALFWANSPYSESYQALWNYKIGFETTDFGLRKPLILWINDGLMAVFFFLIGLEIKREFVIGELNSFKKVAFPLVGAIGGMSIPVIMFLILNTNPATEAGWGIPMATDIAFSLAILNLFGNRIPLSLKIFLTAFAIVDDLGAVIVIAIFYSGEIHYNLLLIAFGLLLIIYTLTYNRIYSKYLSLTFGAVVWFLFLKAGIHPTLAGILLAFSVPVRQNIDTPKFLNVLKDLTDKISSAPKSSKPILDKEQIAHIDELESWIDKYHSPLQHLEHKLHGWVAYFVIPIFAFANAGVAIQSDTSIDQTLVINIVLCLVLGNSIGISGIVLAARKLKIISVPDEIKTIHIIGVSFLAGIGFTMAIFVTGLAFKTNPSFIDSAKIGILIGSFISAIIGYIILRMSISKTSQANYL